MVSENYSPAVVGGLLIATAPLVVEHRIKSTWVSVVVAGGLSICSSRF